MQMFPSWSVSSAFLVPPSVPSRMWLDWAWLVLILGIRGLGWIIDWCGNICMGRWEGCSKVQYGQRRAGEGESDCGIFLVSELHWHKKSMFEWRLCECVCRPESPGCHITPSSPDLLMCDDVLSHLAVLQNSVIILTSMGVLTLSLSKVKYTHGKSKMHLSPTKKTNSFK